MHTSQIAQLLVVSHHSHMPSRPLYVADQTLPRGGTLVLGPLDSGLIGTVYSCCPARRWGPGGTGCQRRCTGTSTNHLLWQ